MPTKAKNKDTKSKNEDLPLTEEALMEEDEEPQVTIEDLPSVGPATAEKLKKQVLMSCWLWQLWPCGPCRTSGVR